MTGKIETWLLDQGLTDVVTGEWSIRDATNTIYAKAAEWDNEIEALQRRNAELTAALEDMRDHGLRTDLTPTIVGRNTDCVPSGYLQGIDRHLRLRAARALTPTESERHQCAEEEDSR